MHRIEVDHRSIFYRDEGDGPAVVLLHGFLCDSRAWRPQLRDLSDGYRVVAWDAAGAGPSDDPPETFSIADWADDLRRLLEALAVEEAHVVGLSWGGLVAQAFYGLYPSRVRSLVLSDTYAGWKGSLPPDVVAKRLTRCLSESELAPAELVARWVPMEFFTEAVSDEVTSAMADIVSDFHPLGFRLMARSLAENDTTSLLPTIRVPTLLLWGEADQRSPIEVAERFRDAIPNAELRVTPRRRTREQLGAARRIHLAFPPVPVVESPGLTEIQQAG
jgi:pimeloyl-ACP methyl ester carboxylesterase